MVTPEQLASRLKAKTLPSLPLTVVALGEAVQDDRCTVDRILGILSRDPSLSATLLRLANSALYAGDGAAADLRTAVLRLGFDAIANLGTGAAVIRTLRGGVHLDALRLWQHSVAVGQTARGICRLARRHGQAETAFLGGLLHDIGKVAVPEHVLHKPGKLTEAEFRQVMAHPVVGWEICRRLRSAQPVLDVIRSHHERFDGRGYPDGLAGEAIPWSARILSVADALDALTSERPYRASLTVAEGIDLLRRETAGGKWDPRVFAALLRLDERDAADPRRQSS